MALDAEAAGVDVGAIDSSLESRRQVFQSLNREVIERESECSRCSKIVDDLAAQLREAKSHRKAAAAKLDAAIQARNIDTAARLNGEMQAGDQVVFDLEGPTTCHQYLPVRQ